MSVIRMGSSAVGTHKGEGQEGVPQSHSKAEQQLQELLSKQLDVTKDGFERCAARHNTAHTCTCVQYTSKPLYMHLLCCRACVCVLPMSHQKCFVITVE